MPLLVTCLEHFRNSGGVVSGAAALYDFAASSVLTGLGKNLLDVALLSLDSLIGVGTKPNSLNHTNSCGLGQTGFHSRLGNRSQVRLVFLVIFLGSRRRKGVNGFSEGSDRGLKSRLHRLGNSLDILFVRSEEHTSELQSRGHLVCRLLLEK